ncbi:MAG: hypothetical protein D6753_04660 [Planctomycetota bacterium]|nr:MAG: hypothetical protein D6753_04660 [Planctomycetota bacterium]
MIWAKRKPQRIGCAVIAAGLLIMLGLLLGTTGLFLHRYRAAANRVARHIDRLAREGGPIDNVTLDQYYRQHTDTAISESWVRLLDAPDLSDLSTQAVALPIIGSVANVVLANSRCKSVECAVQ